MTLHEPYRMTELDEVLGPLHALDETDNGLVALIGKIHVLLPREMSPRLQEMMGQRIGILRYEGYRLRVLE